MDFKKLKMVDKVSKQRLLEISQHPRTRLKGSDGLTALLKASCKVEVDLDAKYQRLIENF